MSNASEPRTSPTMMRSGLIRRAFRTSSRCVTSPLPSRLAGRASKATTWPCCRRSSVGSSMVTMRSVSGMNEERALSIVVLPVPVPPETMVFRRTWTQARKNSASSRVKLPTEMRSSIVILSAWNFLIVIVGLFAATGGMTTLTRDPSGRRASTIGDDSSTRRPSGATMRSMIRRMWASSRKRTELR